jgi:hypothetical protein
LFQPKFQVPIIAHSRSFPDTVRINQLSNAKHRPVLSCLGSAWSHPGPRLSSRSSPASPQCSTFHFLFSLTPALGQPVISNIHANQEPGPFLFKTGSFLLTCILIISFLQRPSQDERVLKIE